MDDRRQYRRQSVEMEVSYQNRERTVIASSRDVSLGGVFLFDSNPPPLGTAIDLLLRLQAPFGELRVNGEVVHHLPGIGIGVRFGATEVSKIRLLSYLEHLGEDSSIHAAAAAG